MRYSGKFHIGNLHPEVQPLPPLFTILTEKRPLYLSFFKKDTPFKYLLKNTAGMRLTNIIIHQIFLLAPAAIGLNASRD